MPHAPRLVGGYANHMQLMFLNIGLWRLFGVSFLWIAILKTFISQRVASQVQ